MFATAQHPDSTEAIIERPRIPDDLLHVIAETAAAQRIVCFVVEGDIEYRTQVEVESEDAEESPGDFAMTADQPQIPAVSELIGVGRLVADQLQTGNAPALLIYSDDWLHFA